MDQSQYLKNLNQLKAFARQDGFLLSLVWIASMASIFYAPQSSWGSLLMLSTPFFVGWRLVCFRRVLGGAISFRRALAYCMYTFACSCVVFALAQFVYFRYLDHGHFMQMMTEAVETLTPIYQQQGIDPTELGEALKNAKSTTPLNLTILFFSYNLIIGLIVSPLIALVCQRRKKG